MTEMTPTDRETVLFGTEFDEFEYGADPTPARDTGAASFHHRVALAIAAEAAESRALFDAEIAALVARRDSVAAVYAGKHRWHASAVESWHRASFAAGSVGKTVKLVHGNSELRASLPKLVVSDEDALRAFLVMHDLEEAVYVPKPAPMSRSALKKLFSLEKGEEAGSFLRFSTADGEVVPGVNAIASGNRFQGAGEVKS